MTSSECIFCRIVAGEIPADVVASNDLALAFRDLNPQAPTHVLVVPRRHVRSAHDIEMGHAEDLAAMFLLAQEVARVEGIDDWSRGYRLLMNVGEESGNTVPHLHMHLVGGRPMRWPPG